jgi:3-(3-hydroxy-phenyl)propionate hydroxylase
MAQAAAAHAPVVIAGAGPTGLAAAIDLGRFGVPVRLIDSAVEPATHSRAIAIQPRTLEMLQQRDCVQPFLDRGHKAYAANFYSGDRRILHLDFRPLRSPFPSLLFLEQSQTERILLERLEQLGVHVERGVELVAFRDSRAGLELTLKHHRARDEHTWAPYLVGCDGAQSLVRKHLGLGFEGKSYPQTFALADLHVAWDRTDDEFYIFASGEGLTAIFPLGNGLHRVVADFSGVRPNEEPSLEECQSILDRRLPQAPRVSDLRWSAYFHVNSRRVERLKCGRVFVAGDAAHSHSPAAGQGMNTGIQESFNLAWKLALVVRGDAGPGLLETYDEERRPIERSVLAATDIVTNIVGARHGVTRFLWNHVLPHFASLEATQRWARRFVTEMNVSYDSSPLTFERSIYGGVRAGERAPDANLNILSGPDGRSGHSHVFDLLSAPRFELLLVVDPKSASSATLERASATISDAIRAPLGVWQVSDAPGTAGQQLVDLYGRSRPSFYLIRPDGYVMARGRMSDAKAAANFCSECFWAPERHRAFA